MPLLGSIHWHVNILLHLMVTVFVACVNGFHGSKHNIVYLCKQECLWMGYEHQYKQSILNITDNGVANNHSSLRACTTVFKVCRENVFILFPASICELVLKPITARRLSRADCKMSRPLITVVDFRGAGRAVGPSVLSMPLQLNWVSLRNARNSHTRCFFACGHAALTYTVGDFLFTVMSVDCLSYSLTKWNFHFLVCKWVSPSAFVWYLFIQCMWQEQCTLINISAFTSL